MGVANTIRWPLYLSCEIGPTNFSKVGPVIRAGFQNPENSTNAAKVFGYMHVDPASSGILIDASVIDKLALSSTDSTEVFAGSANQPMHVSQNLIFRVKLLIPSIDVDGHNVIAAFPVDAVRVEHPVTGQQVDVFQSSQADVVIGRIGRLFLQFVQMVVAGPTGSIDVTIFEDVMHPKMS